MLVKDKHLAYYLCCVKEAQFNFTPELLLIFS